MPLGAISPGRMVVPFPQIVINLPTTYEKQHCKGDLFVQTDTQKSCYFYISTSGYAP